jgi:4-diphosphocytidyl-2-C-methyl-D-erythritol kinase
VVQQYVNQIRVTGIGREIIERACCKVNLGLEVLRKRQDGYHDINTVFAALQLSDAVEVREIEGNDVELTVIGNDALAAEPAESNLCVKAARACISSGLVDSGISITLTKQIPSGAGLGGGSSDAAAVLRACAALGNEEPDFGRLTSLAAPLGSDIPFFLNGSFARGGGTGTRIEKVDLIVPWSILLVKPELSINTTGAYGAVDPSSGREATDLPAVLQKSLSEPGLLRERVVNDFEGVMFEKHPQLRQIKDALYASGAFFALMCGSGSSFFGLFDSEHQADAARHHFADEWTCVTSFCGPEGS